MAATRRCLYRLSVLDQSYFMVSKQSLCLMLIFELCMLLGKLLCIKFLNWIMVLICSILNIVLVFCL